MSAVEKIRAKLEAYPGLTYKAEVDSICVDAPTDSGFSVCLFMEHPGFTVTYDGWHERIDDEQEALNAFGFGLCDECRLKVTKRGRTDCHWMLEAKDGDTWREVSAVGLVMTPFWRRKSVEYRQNAVIVRSDSDASKNATTAMP